MSSETSKSEGKRARTSTGDSNSSFVKAVTSRVSGLLPATITKWFSSPSKSSSTANGVTTSADVSDSSSDDESPVIQPPTKRMRYASPGSKFSCIKETANAVNDMATGVDISETKSTSVLYNSIQPRINNMTTDSNYVSNQFKNMNAETNTDRNERDASCSSHTGVLKQTMSPRKSIFDMAPSAKRDHLSACAKTTSSTPKESRAPCFNPSLLSSPFYSGRTMYGGASTSTYINQPNIRQSKVTCVNESKHNETVNMSYSARQVMDLLESISSPLVEARRIPVISRNPNAMESVRYDPINLNRSLKYRTQELHVPSIASILRLKQRSRLMDTTKVARQIIASHSSTLSFQPNYGHDTQREDKTDNEENISASEPPQSKTTSKLKTRLTRRPRGNEIDAVNDLPETVQLPTAVLLIDKNNLPKFSFGGTSQQTTSTSSKTTFTQTPPNSEPLPTTITSSKATMPMEQNSATDMFKFTSPVKINLDTSQKDIPLSTFTFVSPERKIDIKDSPKVSTTLFNNKKESQSAMESDWKCPECWVSNKASAQKCICCGAKQPSKDTGKQNMSEDSSKTNKIPVGIKLPGNWNCTDCWVSNLPTNENCVCCGSKNPDKTTAQTSVKTTASVTKDWKCEDCWISNKSSVDKCAACGGAKPGTKSSAPTLPAMSLSSNVSTPTNQFTEIVKKQKAEDKWECPTCLVTNSSDKSSCVCCGTEKSGGDKESTKKLFNFSTNANVSFKFGIDPKQQEESIKKSDDIVKPAFAKTTEETNNNIVPKMPTFSLSSVISKSDDKIDVSKTDSPIPTFTFGIPKTSLAPITSPTFNSKLPEPALNTKKVEDKEKLQEVPKIDFQLPVHNTNKLPSGGFFTSPLTTKSSELPTPTFGVFHNSSSDKQQKETVVSTESKVVNSTTPATFSFSAGGIKPSVPVFGAPSSTAPVATGITLGTPLQTSGGTTSASGMSLFQKPETIAPTMSIFQNKESTTASSMFQKSETTTVLSAAPTPAAPIVSFGSNTSATPTSNAAATLDKPKFNFMFGNSNNTENQNTGLFKPPFSSTTENNSNKFTLPAAGTLGNALGNNGLSTGTILGGNSLGGNNTMPGSILGTSSDNTMQAGNGMSAAPIFGNPMQKDAWPNNNASNNIFGSSGTTNNIPKPAPFAFGAPTPFSAGNSVPNSQPPPNIFGTNAQPTQNIFGMGNQNNASQPSLFQSPPQSQPAPMFGAPNPTPSLFGNPTVGATPGFGGQNQPMAPTFVNPQMAPPAQMPVAQMPFNFGAQQAAPPVFGFGQSTPQNAGVYSFGGTAPAAPQQLQFNMGSAPNTTVRRLRKAVRRTTQR